jgi:uncharacterized protein (TIGR04255 family)
MTKMNNAPVVYVIGVIRFPVITDFDSFAKEVSAAIADDYPAGKDLVIPQISLVLGDQGVQVQSETVKIWQYRTVDFKSAVFLNKDAIGLHTIAYDHHEDFLDRLLKVAKAAVKTGQVRLVETIALRYLDLIVPKEGEGLSQYVDEKVLPDTIDVAGLNLVEGVTSLNMDTGMGSALRVQIARKPAAVFPVDLNSPLLIDNKWNIPRPSGDFATLDADHSMTMSPPSTIDLGELRTNMFNLRQPIRDIFDKITTQHAMEVWK